MPISIKRTRFWLLSNSWVSHNLVRTRTWNYTKLTRFVENEKKRLYARRVLEIEQGTFTPLVFTTTVGMGKERMSYHSRLAESVAIKKGEGYVTPMSWIRARISFALLRSALTCLRGSGGRKIIYMIWRTSMLIRISIRWHTQKRLIVEFLRNHVHECRV